MAIKNGTSNDVESFNIKFEITSSLISQMTLLKLGNNPKLLVMHLGFKLFFIFLLTTVVSISHSQNRLFKNYTISDGLPGSTIYHMLQDSKGFMWFGTDQGLSRYDGTEFKNYTALDGLSDNNVFRISEDSLGRLWMICYNSKPCYLYDGIIHNSDNDTMLANIDAEWPMFVNIAVDKEGRTWILGKKVYIIEGNNYAVFNAPLNHQLSGIGYVRNEWWIATDFNVYKTNYEKKKLTYKLISPIRTSPGHAPVFTNIGCFDLEALSRTRSGITVIKNDTTFLIDLHGIGVSEIIWNHTVYDARDSVLYISDAGSGIKALKNGVTPIPDPYPFLPHNDSYTYSLFDKEGNTWISTLRRGVYFLPKEKVIHYKPAFADNSSAANAVFKNSTDKIFSGAECLSYGVLKNNTFHTYSIGDKTNGKKVVRFCSISNKTLLMATESGLYAVDGNKGCVTSLIDASCIKNIVQDGANSVLVATTTHAYRLTLTNDKIKFDTIWNERTSALIKGKDGRIWIGSPKGLFIYDGKHVRRFVNKSRISESRITDLVCDEHGCIWVATSKYGLFIIKKDSIIDIKMPGSLAGQMPNRLFFETKGNIWVCLSGSISKIAYSYTNGFNYEVMPLNGLLAYPGILPNDIFVDSTSIWLATSEGILKYPKQVAYSNAPPIFITSFKISDSVFTNYDHIELDYFQNNIEIAYRGISYNSAGKLMYKYVLSNRANDTTYTYNNTLNLNELSSGKYVLNVWCKNSAGIWSSKPAVIRFIVQPPFWHTWWFIAVSSLLLVSLIGVLLRWRIKVVTKREQEKTAINKKIAETELQAVRAQMNEHFIFNSLNSIQNFINQNDAASASFYLANFGRLIRQTLEISESPTIALDDEIEYLNNYLSLEKMRFADKLNYKITNEVSTYASHTVIFPSMLLQPYVENAIRHGLGHKQYGDGLLLITFTEYMNGCKCVIDDNGVGRKKAMELKDAMYLQYQSKGMKLADEKVLLFNIDNVEKMTVSIEDKYDAEGRATGTRVSIFIPIKFD